MQNWRNFTLLLLALAAICTNILADSLQQGDEAAEKFLKRVNDSEYVSSQKFSAEIFRLANTEEVSGELLKQLLADILKLHEEAKQFDLSQIKNETTKAALQNVKQLADTFILGEQEYFSKFEPATANLTAVLTDKDIEPYLNGIKKANYSDDELLSFDPQILNIIRTSNNADELKYYWLQWRDKNAGTIETNLKIRIECIKKAAKLLDMPLLDFVHNDVYGKNLSMDSIKVMRQLHPSFRQLHAFLRHELQRKYPKGVNDTAAIPAHLAEQIVEQIWSADSILQSHSPFEQLPEHNKLVQQKYNAKGMLQEANRFMTSMGFESFDEQYMDTHMKQLKTQADDSECNNQLLDYAAEPWLLYCDTVNFRKFVEMHESMLRAYYNKESSNLPIYFFDSYNLDNAAAKAVGISMAQPKHLTKIGLTEQTDYELQRLLRLIVPTYFNLIQQFVMSQLFEDLLAGRVEYDELNKTYWTAMHDIFGIAPPGNRFDYLYNDFSYSFYRSLDKNEQAIEVYATIMGFQLFEALCEKSGQADLNSCVFDGNQEIGAALKSIMSLGSNTPYEQIVGKILTKNTALSVDALLKYFAKALNYIEAKNKENGVKIGWEPEKISMPKP